MPARVKGVAALKKDADKWFSKYIRLRDSDTNGMGNCITCNRPYHWKQAQAGHFVSRRVNSLRYDERNVHLQCYACNVMEHGSQYEYARQVDLRYGDGVAAELHARRFETHKFTTGELQKIIDESKEYVKERT
jgi:hypothetical protein